MKRTIVQEGKKSSDGETSSGAVTPTTQVTSVAQSEDPQPIEEKRRSANDIEKGLNESRGGSVDLKDEKDEIGERYVKKG